MSKKDLSDLLVGSLTTLELAATVDPDLTVADFLTQWGEAGGVRLRSRLQLGARALRQQEILDQIDRGMSIAEIAARNGVRPQAIYYRLTRGPGFVRQRNTERVQEAYANGASIAEIAARLKITQHTVRRRLKKVGVEYSKNPRRVNYKIKDIVQQLELEEIARSYNITEQALIQHMEQRGLQLKALRYRDVRELRSRAMADMALTGATTTEIAEHFKATAGTVMRAAKEHGVTLTKCSRKVKAPREELIEMTKAPGATVRSIAEQYGVTTSCIRKVLKQLGVEPPKAPPHRKIKVGVDEILAMMARGMKIDNVGDQLGVSSYAIRYYLKKAGLKPPQGAKK